MSPPPNLLPLMFPSLSDWNHHTIILKPVYCLIFFFLFHLLYLVSPKALYTLPSYDIFPTYHAIGIFCLNYCVSLSVINWSLTCLICPFSNLFPALLPEESVTAKYLLTCLKPSHGFHCFQDKSPCLVPIFPILIYHYPPPHPYNFFISYLVPVSVSKVVSSCYSCRYNLLILHILHLEEL